MRHESIARQAQPRISTRSSAVLAKSHVRFHRIPREGVGTSHYVLSLCWDQPNIIRHLMVLGIFLAFSMIRSGKFPSSWFRVLYVVQYMASLIIVRSSQTRVMLSTRREVTAGGGNADAIAPHHSQTRR